jgi:hypothetical protein
MEVMAGLCIGCTAQTNHGVAFRSLRWLAQPGFKEGHEFEGGGGGDYFFNHGFLLLGEGVCVSRIFSLAAAIQCCPFCARRVATGWGNRRFVVLHYEVIALPGCCAELRK